MAGDWIKMSKDLLTHPKVVRMSSALRADRFRTVGGLFAVWCLFDTHSTDGQLSGYTPDAIDELAGFPGISTAMEAVGWLSHDGDGVYLPRFEEHNGQSAKRRAQETERKREVRKVSASDADKKRTREEKRREEKYTSADADVVRASGAPPQTPPADPPAADLPTDPSADPPAERQPRASRKCPASFAVTDELMAWAAQEVPGLDVQAQTQAFRDHTFGTARTDWAGTWRNWMRKASTYARASPAAPAKPSKHTGFTSMDYREGVTEDGTLV